MPGLVALGRRWSVGSDDLVVPGIFLLLVHLSWLGVVVTIVVGGSLKSEERCVTLLWQTCLCYAVILAANCILEAAISVMAMRGGILDTEPRRNIRYILYLRLSLMIVEMAWLSYAAVWLATNYTNCPLNGVKEAVLGMVACNWAVILALLLMGWCVFDSAGRSWVKMKKYQRSMRESASRFQYKRSGSRGRNWRHRKVLRAYQDSWDHRCRLLFCCIRNSDRSKNSFTDIARLLSDFFRDLDVVPSDVVAGLVLLRKFQKIEREANMKQHKNDTYEYLSGVPITPRTKFLPLGDVQHYRHFEAVVHFMHYALAAYGWPMLIMTSPFTTYCKLCSNLSCCCQQRENVDGDNPCSCNYAALKGMLNECGRVEIIYATYHVDVAQTPFFVAIDFTRRKIVVSIRGTLSMKDVITDLNAESETLPLNPPKEDWLGHKGMVEAAVYIRDKIEKENILKEAFTEAEKQCPDEIFGLVLVGHSLGAGTASILAILLRQIYPDLQCFAYSPPGGLLSMPAVQYTKAFITSVVLGKDVVPRIGLYQMESLRADLINAIKRSKDPKWKTITCSVLCCGCAPMPTSAVELEADTATMSAYQMEKNAARAASVHPSDSTIALTLHQPLYPPGSIIHVVRHHPSKTEHVLKKRDPVYQAIWANNTDFDEVLISPVMIQDHMPDKVLDALVKVITSLGPAKPQRAINNNKNSSPLVSELIEHCQVISGTSSNSRPSRILFETSFTSNDLANPSPATVVLNCSDRYKTMFLSPAPLATPESSEVNSICSGDLSVFKRLPGDEDDSLTDWYSKRRKCDYVVNPSSAESSPLLSSLHLLTDRRFAELLGLQDNASTSASFQSAEPVSLATPTSVASVNSIGRLESSIGGESLLEDIERSLGVDLSCSGSLAKLSLKLRESKDSELHKSDYLYPVLHIAPGESSV